MQIEAESGFYGHKPKKAWGTDTGGQEGHALELRPETKEMQVVPLALRWF